MYCNKDNVNQLTALLVAHGIRHAVVCPGSRNGAIVHNLNACPGITCHAVTDERSAAFYALGLAQATQAPVVVCVTSGTALLNTAPAVAEATFQHHGIVVISADRPSAWIGQLDGQTMPQPGALGTFVARCVNLPEPHDAPTRWECNRLVNEALITAWKQERPSVHINVPISEPLFEFTTPELPAERAITCTESHTASCSAMASDYAQARKPMIVIGQLDGHCNGLQDSIARIARQAVVLSEPLSPTGQSSHCDEVLHAVGPDEAYMPDFVLYAGGTIVSKRLKKFLRLASGAAMWELGESVHDTFMHLKGVVDCDLATALDWLHNARQTSLQAGENAYVTRWHHALDVARDHAATFEPQYSQLRAVQLLERKLDMQQGWHCHYANSTAVRLAGIYARHYVWCNRGINGIDGSTSTAAGYAAATPHRVMLVTGDLSFFYDQNALWNQDLRGNLRIMLLNNGMGGIFNQLKGLDKSPARDTMIAGSHHTSAQGLCQACRVSYLAARNEQELETGLQELTAATSDRPIVLEVFTRPEADAEEYKRYYSTLHIESSR